VKGRRMCARFYNHGERGVGTRQTGEERRDYGAERRDYWTDQESALVDFSGGRRLLRKKKGNFPSPH
jgi:hypothetical protein